MSTPIILRAPLLVIPVVLLAGVALAIVYGAHARKNRDVESGKSGLGTLKRVSTSMSCWPSAWEWSLVACPTFSRDC